MRKIRTPQISLEYGMRINYKQPMKLVSAGKGRRLMGVVLTAVFLLSIGCDIVSADDRPLELVHADKLISSGGDDNNLTHLVGNVHLRHGNIELRSDRATWSRRTDVAAFNGAVSMIDSSRSLFCNHLTYYRATGSAMAVGGVILRDSVESATLTANKVDYNRESGKMIATGGPIMKLGMPDDTTRITISADTIVYDFSAKVGFAKKGVVITRGSLRATCDSASFHDKGAEIILEGDPHAFHRDGTVEGDRIRILTADRAITGMVVDGNAVSHYSGSDDSLLQRAEATLKGKQLEVFFENERATKAVMRRNASSIYVPAPSDTLARGINYASGDSITLFFDESRISRVLVLGGAQGKYIEQKTGGDGSVKPETTYYEGREIDYLVADGKIVMSGASLLKYQQLKLESASIKYNIDERILIAEGIPVETDSGSILEGAPVLYDADQKLNGNRMTYNIETRRGKVEVGWTQYEQGYYKGKKLRQVEEDVLFVESGSYTSCELAEPHYHFYSQKMKMKARDKIFAKPVVLFIGPIPVAALPYYVFPIRKGRHSGFLTFELGSFQKGQRYIRKLGYYWAASDYWDIQGGLDIYENDRVIVNGMVNYALRYRLSGNIGGSFTRTSRWLNYQRNISQGWAIRFAHNQTLTQSMSLRAGGSFQSDKSYILDTQFDPQERLNRTVRASASLNQKWKNSSIAIAADQSWNLDTDAKTQLLPSISFNRSSLPIFPTPDTDGRARKRILPWEEPPEKASPKWYNSIYFSLQSDYQRKRSYLQKKAVADWQAFQTLNSRIAFSAPQKLGGILTLNPSANITQTIYKIDQIHSADTLSFATDGYYRREVWSAALTASTAIYGTVYPNLLSLTGLRHVMNPSISYNYRPKIDKNKEFVSYTGVGTSSVRSRTISMSLRNLFQARVKKGESDRKFDLFNLDFSSGYNFEAKTKKWSNISSSLNSSALKIVTVSASSSHSLYHPITGELNLTSPRLESFSLSSSLNRSIRLGYDDENSTLQSDEAAAIDYGQARRKDRTDRNTDGLARLDFNLSYRYSESRGLTGKSITRWVDSAFDLNLTPGWKFQYSLHYDFKAKKASSQNLKISRDLHCWQGEFIWVPTGALAGYYFRIYIKQHQDIKIEQSRGGVRGGYY